MYCLDHGIDLHLTGWPKPFKQRFETNGNGAKSDESRGAGMKRAVAERPKLPLQSRRKRISAIAYDGFVTSGKKYDATGRSRGRTRKGKAYLLAFSGTSLDNGKPLETVGNLAYIVARCSWNRRRFVAS